MDTKEWKELKNLLSSLLISNPLQATIRSLNNDFRNEIGHNIPYEKFGFRTLEQCLDNMTDVLERNGSFITVRVSSKSAHIDKLVSRQMIPSNRRTKHSGTFHNRQQRRSTLLNDDPERRRSLLDKPSTKMIPPLFPSSGILMTPPKHFMDKLLISRPFRKDQQTNVVPKTPQPQRKVYTNTPNPNIFETSKPIPESTLRPAKSESHIVPASSTNLDKVEQRNTRKEDSSAKIEPTRYIVNSTVPLEMQKNLIKLISKFENGIWCAELPETYQRLYKKELDYTKYGFKNLILMCMSLEKIFYCYRPNRADFILYDRMKPLPDDFEAHFMQPIDCKMKPTEVNTVINTIPKPLYPLNVLKLFDVVPKQFTSCDIKKDDFIEVRVADIYHPGQFFIILIKFSTDLDKLMDTMQSFYLKHKSELAIPRHMINENLYCVTLYDNEYHRAKIIEMQPHLSAVKVFCFDYGSIDIVDFSSLFYLHKQFAVLPQQAIEAQLAGIKSHDFKEEWSKQVSLRFLELTQDKDLFAHIFNVDRVRQRLEVFLVDTNGETDVYLNDALVNEGYALFKHQTKDHCKANVIEKDKPGGRKALLKTLQQLYARKC